MYAVIATGGKQYRVQVGSELNVEQLSGAEEGSIKLRPVMVVDDDGAVTAARDALSAASVTATLLDTVKGRKLTVFKYKNKTGYRRKAGHRQRYSRIRIDDISL